MLSRGVIIALFVIFVSMVIQPVNAGVSTDYLSWDYSGVKVGVDVENIDYATSGIPLDVYLRFTLKDVGRVADFRYLILEVMLVTETIYLAHSVIYNPWSKVGDTLNLKVAFNVTADDIKNAEWDMYEAAIYYQLNQSVQFLNGGYQLLYTQWRGPYHVGFSTYTFIIYWPWPPIILMTCIYWFGFWGLYRFNRRYNAIKYLDKVKEKTIMHKTITEAATKHSKTSEDQSESERETFDI